MIVKKFILLNAECETQKEVVEKLSEALIDQGIVSEDFPQAVLEREKEYPTGLPAEAFDVAIPHASSDYVNEPAICLATLQKPIAFHHMVTKEVLYPELIIMLAINSPKQHLDLLKRIMVLIQNTKALMDLKKSQTTDEAIGILDQFLSEEV